METISLVLDEANRVVVYLFGATVTSWIANNEERLFLSEKAVLDNKKAIRGGIPVVFPNFGPWDGNRPQHGFARLKTWKARSAPVNENDSVKLTLYLNDDEETRQLWNFKFELSYEIVLTRNSLKTTLNVINNDDNPFDFTCLLHTYFRVPDITQVSVEGLKGLTFVDKVANSAELVEANDEVRVSSEVDRVYQNSPNTHTLQVNHNQKLVIKKNNLIDTVVWNPWIEKAAKMADFGDDEYKQMICIEPGSVSKRLVLNPKEQYQAAISGVTYLKRLLFYHVVCCITALYRISSLFGPSAFFFITNQILILMYR